METRIINDNNTTLVQHQVKDVDLVVTSPPYDSARTYTGESEWNFETFKASANAIYNSLKNGGILIWIIQDPYVKGGKTMTSFKQALYFTEQLGMKLHDEIIWEKPTFAMPSRNRNHQIWEHVFVFKKGNKPHTFNPIMDKEIKSYTLGQATVRQKDGTMRETALNKRDARGQFGMRFNIYKSKTTAHELPMQKIPHPATFPLQLAQDLIYSYSNENDVVLDPFMGYGTTHLACVSLKRSFIGMEISKQYIELYQARYKKFVEVNQGKDCGDIQITYRINNEQDKLIKNVV